MKIIKYLRPIIIATLIVVIISSLINGLGEIKNNIIYYFVFSATFYVANMGYFYVIGKYLGWKKHPETTLIFSILLVIPFNAIIYFLLKLILFHQGFEQFTGTHVSNSILEYLFVIMIALLISMFFIIGSLFKKIREEQLRAEQLKTQNEKIKLLGIKNQFDPHFLFNNLNVLTALIAENPEKAEEFTLKLADIYKYVLAQKEQNTVPLQQEINFAKQYLDLLKIRFENGINYKISGSVPENAKIPPLTLQIILENLVKHNQIDDYKPLKVEISVAKDYLIIKNNKNTKQNNNKNSGYGIDSIKKRYNLLSSKKVKIQNEKDFYKIEIPLL